MFHKARSRGLESGADALRCSEYNRVTTPKALRPIRRSTEGPSEGEVGQPTSAMISSETSKFA
jgi:hypothetical protein